MLVLRALVPLGFMPGQTADGELALVICSGSGLKHLSPEADGTSKPVSGKSHADQPCTFAGLTAAPPPATVITPVRHVIGVVAVTWTRSEIELPPARAGPSLGSRAPPLAT